MIQSKKHTNNVNSLKTVVMISVCVGMAFCLTSAESGEALIGIIIGVSILGSLAIGYYIGRKSSENRGQDTGEDTSAAYLARSHSLKIKWENWASQTFNRVDTYNAQINTDFLYYTRRAENQIPSYLSELTFTDEIGQNVTQGLTEDYALFLSSVNAEIATPSAELNLKGWSWNQDGGDPRGLSTKYWDGAQFGRNLASNNNQWVAGYYIGSGTPGNYRTFWSSAMIGFPEGGYFNATITNYDTGEVDVMSETSSFELSQYGQIRIDITSGFAVVHGINSHFDMGTGIYTYNLHHIQEIDSDDFVYRQDYGHVNEYLLISSVAPAISENIDPTKGIFNTAIPTLLANIGELHFDVIENAGLLFIAYRALGYDSPDDIPIGDAPLPPPDLIWWDSDTMDLFDFNESLVMYLSYLQWLNDTDLAVDFEGNVDGLSANFTNAKMIVKMSLLQYNSTYTDGDLDTWVLEDTVFTSHDAIIIPLEETLSFEKGNNTNMSQNAWVVDLETHQFYNLVYDQTARENNSILDYVFIPHNITDDGIEVDNGSYTISTVEEFGVAEYGATLPIWFLDAGASPATTYLIIAGIVAGAGLGIMVISASSPRFKAWSGIGRLMLYGGIIGAGAIAIWYWVIPYLSDLWSGFTSWWPF